MGSMRKNCIDNSIPKVEAGGTSLIMAISKRLSNWTARNMSADACCLDALIQLNNG